MRFTKDGFNEDSFRWCFWDYESDAYGAPDAGATTGGGGGRGGSGEQAFGGGGGDSQPTTTASQDPSEESTVDFSGGGGDAQAEAAAGFNYGFSVPTGPVVDTTRTEGAMRDLGRSPFSTPASAKDMTLQRSSYGGEDLGTVYANSFLDRALDRFDPIKPYFSGRDLPPSILGMDRPLREGVAQVAQKAAPEMSEEAFLNKVQAIP